MRLRQSVFLLLTILLLFFLFLPQPLFASGFQLKTVGALNVEGVTYNHLWYTNENITFTGIALANAQITAIIDGTSNTVTADSSGNWSYTATLPAGDHQISFTSNEGTLSFTLTVGEVPEGVGGLPTTETPTVGIITPTIAGLFTGGFLISLAVFLLRKNFSLN